MIFRACPLTTLLERLHSKIGNLTQISFRYVGADIHVIVHTHSGRRGSCTIELQDQARDVDAVIADVQKCLVEDLRA
jgi:hypothetical protein